MGEGREGIRRDGGVSFSSIHSHGFVRVAGCTPRTHVGDPGANAEETLALMREGETRDIDLMVFPELGLSAYAVDDLHLQDALLDGVEQSLAGLVEASKALRPVFVVGAPLRRNNRLYNCAIAFAWYKAGQSYWRRLERMD